MFLEDLGFVGAALEDFIFESLDVGFFAFAVGTVVNLAGRMG